MKIDEAEREIRRNEQKIRRIISSGVITPYEDHEVRMCRRFIVFNESLLICYHSWMGTLLAEGLSEAERIERERKAYELHKAASALLEGKILHF